MIKELKMLKIAKVIDEAANVRSFIFNHPIDFEPGQFIMVWIPRVNEKPFTISYHNKEQFGITIFKVGDFTSGLYEMKVGDCIGARGPYGSRFTLSGNSVAVGGGVGMASIAPLDSKIENLTIIQGAKTKSALLYKERFPKMIICTDDGSEGLKGFPTDHLADLFQEKKFDNVYACGPEIMMKKVFDFCLANGVNYEASLERFMKCGIGVCGQCVCDGSRVCKDGPVFSGPALTKIKDFGNRKMLKSGKLVPL